MKILIVGEWKYPMYEQAFAKALESHGVKVLKFDTSVFFSGYFGWFMIRFPPLGTLLTALNSSLINEAEESRPDWVLFWRCTHIIPSTLKYLKKIGIKLVSYNHDDPFNKNTGLNMLSTNRFLWFWYRKGIPLYDRNFFVRTVNCEEALKMGACSVDIMRQYFVPWLHIPIALTQEEKKRYQCDVVFVGHYESDGREHSVRALVDAGIHLKIWGGHYWSREVLGDLYDRLQPIAPAEGDDYAKVLCGAKICLAFLSKMNRDTFTTRCAEIPACSRVMLAERTEDLLRLFKEDEEACFFSSNKELVEKTRWLLENPDIRDRIAAAGLKRVWADGHDVTSRARSFLTIIDSKGII